MPAWLLWHSLSFSILLSQPLCQHCWPSRSFRISLGIHSCCRFITPLEECLCLASALFHTIYFMLFSYIQENLYGKICPAGDQIAFMKAQAGFQDCTLKMSALKKKKKGRIKGSSLSPVLIIINFNDAVRSPHNFGFKAS